MADREHYAPIDARRVRVMLGGEYVADTVRPLLVWEIPPYGLLPPRG